MTVIESKLPASPTNVTSSQTKSHSAKHKAGSDKYEMRIGHDGKDAYNTALDLTQPAFQVFIINGLTPKSPEARKVVEKIRQVAASLEGLNVLVDLSTSDIEHSSNEYYDLLSPLLKIMPYQNLPRTTSESPFKSHYMVKYHNVSLSFVQLEGFDIADKQAVDRMEKFMKRARKSTGTNIVFERE